MEQHTSTPTSTPASAAKRAHRVTKALTGIGMAAVLAVGGLASAAPAQAADWGGNGDPSSCTDAQIAASKPIYGTRGPTAGKVIGQLQLRWSWACHGNWSRVVLYGGMYTSPVTIEQRIEAEGRSAGANDYNVRTGTAGTSAWTPYLRLSNSQSTACAQVWLSSDFGTLNYHTNGARVCA
jgi:hypothetical protein